MKIKITLLVLLAAHSFLYAQDNESKESTLEINAYTDTYYATYDTESLQQDFLPYTAIGARDNSFGINIAQMGVRYEDTKVRGEFTLHMGDIPSATWSEDYPYLQVANAGFKLGEGVWIDAGFFGTHLGTESFLPKNNNLSSISFLTYHEPFFQAGMRLSWELSDKWYGEIHLLNGYNSMVDNNDAKSLGMLLSYSLSDNASITYTNLYGRENEDVMMPEQIRFYQNVYFEKSWNDKISLLWGMDYGIQSNSDLESPNKDAVMYGGILTVRYQFDEKWSATIRGEMMNDESGFLSGVIVDADGMNRGLEIYGLTLGTEYRPAPNTYLRSEFRYAQTPDKLDVFFDGDNTNTRLEFLVTLGIEVGKIFNF